MEEKNESELDDIKSSDEIATEYANRETLLYVEKNPFPKGYDKSTQEKLMNIFRTKCKEDFLSGFLKCREQSAKIIDLQNLGNFKHILEKQEKDKKIEALEKEVKSLQEYFDNELKERFESDRFIDNVCISYRHDFGLLSEQEKQRVRFDCKEWMRAIQNNWKHHKK